MHTVGKTLICALAFVALGTVPGNTATEQPFLRPGENGNTVNQKILIPQLEHILYGPVRSRLHIPNTYPLMYYRYNVGGKFKDSVMEGYAEFQYPKHKWYQITVVYHRKPEGDIYPLWHLYPMPHPPATYSQRLRAMNAATRKSNLMRKNMQLHDKK